VISARQTDSEEEKGKTYLHRGIATRAFERRFTLAEHVKVVGASHENGMLHIDLKREVPEALKPRRIEIAGPNTVETKVIEGERTTEV
jgi:Molecular chaperone (small heat shock protein)